MRDMTSINSVEYNLPMYTFSLSLSKLSLLMSCLMLKVFAEVQNICLHRTASNLKVYLASTNKK